MTCLTCAHGALRDPTDRDRDNTLRAMAPMGAINCLLSPCRASFYAFGRQCEKFEQAEDGVVSARCCWVEKNAGAIWVGVDMAREPDVGCWVVMGHYAADGSRVVDSIIHDR